MKENKRFSDYYYLGSDGEYVLIDPIIRQDNYDYLCSVIIPCYNYGRFLHEAVESVLNQTLKNVELIVVDDGSTDEATVSAVQSLVESRNVTVISKKNEGLSEARNSGIRLASGKYICCLDADDILHPSYLEHCIYELESDGRLGFVYSWVKLFGSENYIWKTRDFSLTEAMVDNHTSVSAVYRKADWLLAGGYDARMKGGYEDWEFWLRIAQLGRKGRAIQAPLFFHRRHGKTMTHDAHDIRDTLVKKKRELNYRLFNDSDWRGWVEESLKSTQRVTPFELSTNQMSKSSKETLLCVLPWLRAGGAETIMIDILGYLSDFYDIVILTTLDDEHYLFKKFNNITHNIFHVSSDMENDDFYNIFNYLVDTRNIHSILMSGSLRMYESLPYIANKYNNKVKVVDILHNDSKLGHIVNSIKYTDYLSGTIGVSERIYQSLLKEGVDGRKACFIYNGVDGSTTFTPLSKNRNITDGKVKAVVGFVGRAASEKRPLLFVELIHRLNQYEDVEIQGVMLTSGYLEQDIVRAIAERNISNVEIISDIERKELCEQYRRFDVLVNVSEVEGMPLTVVEALACGCPIAAMDVGNLKEIIKSNYNGILTSANDFEKLVEELHDLLLNMEKLEVYKFNARKSFEQHELELQQMLQNYKRKLEVFYNHRGAE